MNFDGEIKGNIIDVRFALSGKVSRVGARTGDVVKKWDLVASLDRKILQTELDSQLADFEKTRADFEVFNQKNPNPQTELDKYLKTGKQADLNGSVKEVEIAKAKLDMTDLFSPVDGVVIDDGGIVVGLYTTPSNSPVKILDTNSFYFEFEIEQKEISDFNNTRECEIKIEGISENIKGKTNPVIGDGKGFLVRVDIENKNELLLGMKGKINF